MDSIPSTTSILLTPRMYIPVRRAFTLIECLTVVVIIGVVLAVVLPAVMAARRSVRRMQCMANLRQLGLSLNSYYVEHNMFTPVHLYTRSNWSANRMSGFTFLLPYLEQGPLFDSINMNLANTDHPDRTSPENQTARSTTVGVFLCPEDGDPGQMCSYRFNKGRRAANRVTPFDGPFSIGVIPSQATVTDGLTRTAFLSERVGGSGRAAPSDPDPSRDIKLVLWTGPTIPDDDTFIPYCLNAQAESWFHSAGRYWMYSGLFETEYNHNGRPNDPRPSCGGINFGLYPPRSRHSGGVNVLFGDGHVEWGADSIELRVWRALGTHDSAD
jgi:prepilin-type processing-associated H-X9-DG protein/prepilin-type N-terminal cleavage/methylation domain-containing protein